MLTEEERTRLKKLNPMTLGAFKFMVGANIPLMRKNMWMIIWPEGCHIESDSYEYYLPRGFKFPENLKLSDFDDL